MSGGGGHEWAPSRWSKSWRKCPRCGQLELDTSSPEMDRAWRDSGRSVKDCDQYVAEAVLGS